LAVAVQALLALMVVVLKAATVAIQHLALLRLLAGVEAARMLLVQAMPVVLVVVVEQILVLAARELLDKGFLEGMLHRHPVVFGQVMVVVVVEQVAPEVADYLIQQPVHKVAVVMDFSG
jgi:hypothetical protein